MPKKLLISGCSYSCGRYPYGTRIKDVCGIDVTNISRGGASNHTIIRTIYDYVVNNDFRNGNIICQITYTHRIGAYHDVFNQIVDYQPNFMRALPKLNPDGTVLFDGMWKDTTYNHGYPGRNRDEMHETLNEMYMTYLTHVFNEEDAFKDMLYRIDTLKAFVGTYGNQIKFIYWPLIQKETELNELKKRNFFNVDGEYSMLNWSVKGYQICDFDTHLSDQGCELLGDMLYKNIYEKLV